MPRPKKFDYDSDEFYEEIYALALQGLTDAEIAYSLEDKFGQRLDPDTFGQMIHGKYIGWNDKENERRSGRLLRVLTRARAKINSIVRGAYLKGALGGKKIASKIINYQKFKCSCCGEDRNCPACGGSGWVVSDNVAVVQETETELAPSLQALSTWLRHHDPEWREKEEAEASSSGEGGLPSTVNVRITYNQKSDLELQDKFRKPSE